MYHFGTHIGGSCVLLCLAVLKLVQFLGRVDFLRVANNLLAHVHLPS